MSARVIGWSVVLLCATALVACGGGGSDTPEPPPPTPPPTTPPPPSDPPMFEGLNVVRFPMGVVTPVNEDTPYADVLRDCVFSNTRTVAQSCNFGTLPLLGQDTLDPDIEDVLDRVLVSHDWMEGRIREILDAMPEDLKLLMRSVTAMVISTDVRPSFYWTVTGAIYLDADYIWLTPAECAAVPTDADFRAGFGANLRFIMPTRYVDEHGQPAFPVSRPTPTTCPSSARTLADILPNIGRLLYHELAHANDFFPSTRMDEVGTGRPHLSIPGVISSDLLTSDSPLASDVMRGLAGVRFLGNTATTAQLAITPDEVADEFAPDGGIHFYSYSTRREDFAMLFELMMMRLHFGIEVDHAVTNNWNHPDVSCPTGRVANDPECDLLIAWGQRNRLGQGNVLERARTVGGLVLPETEAELSAYLDTVPAPANMTPGRSWFDAVFDGDPSPTLMRHSLDDDFTHDFWAFEVVPPYH